MASVGDKVTPAPAMPDAPGQAPGDSAPGDSAPEAPVHPAIETPAEELEIRQSDQKVGKELPSALEEDAFAFSFRSPEAKSDADGDLEKLSIEQARRAYWSGNETVAMDLYHDLIVLEPAHPDAHGELGNILLKQGRANEAFEAFEQAVKLHMRAGNQQVVEDLLMALDKVD